MTSFHVLAGADHSVEPAAVRRIGTDDVWDALRLGWEDFAAKPSHYVFLVLIYPIIGAVLVVWASGGNALQLIYPLMAGFALLGPVAAIGLYEISRRRELGLDAAWSHAFEVLRSPALPAIAVVGALLVVLFFVWLAVAQAIYGWLYGVESPATLLGLLVDVISTPRGWALLLVGNAIGFVFALVALSTTVVAFPLLLDRDVGARAAIATSMRAVLTNPVPMALWGLIVSFALVAGSVPVLAGLIVVLPVLGHSTWHLYRKVVEVPRSRRGAPAA